MSEENNNLPSQDAFDRERSGDRRLSTCSLLACAYCGGEASPGVQKGSWKGETRAYSVVRCKNHDCPMRPETPSTIFGVVGSQRDEWPTIEQAVTAWNHRATSSSGIAAGGKL
jgi:hypothetical protein